VKEEPRWFGHLIRMDHQRIPQQAFSTVLEGSGYQEGIWPAKDKLERRSQTGSTKYWTHMGRSKRQQPSADKMALTCASSWMRAESRSMSRSTNDELLEYSFIEYRVTNRWRSSRMMFADVTGHNGQDAADEGDS